MAFRSEIADFGAFYERTYQVAYRTALGIVRDSALAADVAQQAYVAAYSQRERFRGDAPAHAWLHRIVVNGALEAIRRRSVTIREIDPAGAPDPSRRASDRVTLFAALARLSDRQRAAVVLRYYLDYDYATIAEILGTTSNNIGVMLNRALERLRGELDDAEAQQPVAVGGATARAGSR
jgi:RNA polymerase sigma-70 factor (ECF subfamily)